MRRPPRPAKARLFSRRLVLSSVLQGSIVLVVVLAIYTQAARLGLDEAQARAFGFAALVAGNFALIFASRSFGTSVRRAMVVRNVALWSVLGIIAVLLAIALYLPAARSLFAFGHLQTPFLLGFVAAGAAILALLEGLKRVLPSTAPGHMPGANAGR